MVFVAFKMLCQGGGIVLAEETMFAQLMEDVGNEVAVEVGALLLAGAIDYGIYLGDGEDVGPEILEAGAVLFCEQGAHAANILENLVMNGAGVGGARL